MKQFSFSRAVSLGCAAALALTLAACGSSSPASSASPSSAPASSASASPSASAAPVTASPASTDMEWTELKVKQDYKADDGTLLMSVDIAQPYPAKNDTAAEKAIAAYYDKLVEVTMAAEYAENLTSAKDEYSGDPSFFADAPYAYTATYQKMMETEHYVSFLTTLYVDMHGAHGSTIEMGQTFNKDTGALVTTDDLFSVPQSEYLPKLADEIEKVAAGTDWSVENLTDSKNSLTESFNSGNFYLTSDALVIFYQAYDIGPYAMGIPTYTLPVSDLGDTLISWN